MNENTNDNLLSIICPVYNEEHTISLFYQRLLPVLANIPDLRYELIFTNNQSTDGTLREIEKLRAKDSSVYMLTFSRNFGYQASILAGMNYARGDAAIVIDVDCEDPPELIAQFVQKWREGYDVCYGIRGKRVEARWVTWFRLLFYRILKLTADTDIILDMAEFALLTRRVRETIIKNKNTFPFLRAEIAYSGFKKIGIPYDRQNRIHGKSYYNMQRMFVFAAAGIMSVSTFPLRAAAYLLPAIVLLNLLGLGFELFSPLSLMFRPLIILDALFIAVSLTAQGLYIARIYKNQIGRPVFIIDWEQSDHRLNGEFPNL